MMHSLFDKNSPMPKSRAFFYNYTKIDKKRLHLYKNYDIVGSQVELLCVVSFFFL
jgi:hypothetical protein